MEAQIDGSGRELQPHGTADFPCAAYETEDTGFPWHWHEEFEAISVLSGELEVAAGDRRLRLSSGQAVLLSPGAPHALFPLPGRRYKECDIVFHPRLLYGAADGVLWRHVRVYLAEAAAGIALPDPESAAQIVSACALCAQKPPLYEFRVREALTHVFCQACAALREPRSVRVPAGPRKDDDQVKEMMRFLQSRLDQPIHLADLARFAHLSERACQRRFRECLNLTPMQYLAEARLTRAAELLREGRLTVTEVGIRCGFQSPGYFARLFHARYGLSPRAWRERK